MQPNNPFETPQEVPVPQSLPHPTPQPTQPQPAPLQNTPPQFQPQPQPEPQPSPTPVKKRSRRTTVALWLLLGPTTLLIVSFLLFALINWMTAGIAPEPSTANCSTTGGTYSAETGITTANDAECSLFGDSNGAGNTTNVVANIMMFIVGAISFITWLPGIIIGSILLATKPKVTTP